MKHIALLALAAATLLLAPSCKKDQNTPAPPPTTEQQLADKVWLVTAVTASPGLRDGNGNIVTDLYSYIPACTQDDTQQFVTGGVLKVDEGPTKCDASDPQTATGTWSASKSGSDTILTATAAGSTVHLNVLSVNDTQMKVSTQDDIFGLGTGTTTTYTLTYTKK